MNEQRAHDVVAHLQAAALEMIAAARAVLDVAEELVKEPGEATAMVATLVDLAGRLAPPTPAGPAGPEGGHKQGPAGPEGGHKQGPAGPGGHKQGPAGPGGHKQRPGVEHIRVS